MIAIFAAVSAAAPAELASISVTPANAAVPVGVYRQFIATGVYSDGTTKDVTSLAQWSSSSGVATVSSNGIATGVSNGSVSITATLGGASGTATLTVTSASLVSITIAPANGALALGTTLQLSATGLYSDGSTQDITGQVVWTSSEPAVLAIHSKGLVQTFSTGAASVSAVMSSASSSMMVTVGPADLVSIAVTPAIPTAPLGTTLQFMATATYTDGTMQDITATASWTSSDPAIATTSGAPAQSGLAATLALGTTTIAASSGAVTASTLLRVTPAVLASLKISPAPVLLPLGTSGQLAAAGTYTDGSQQDLTSSVEWSSSDNSVAVVNPSGKVSSVAVGTTVVSARSGSISDALPVIVGAAALVSVAVAPATASVPAGVNQQFTASGTYTDGTTADLTRTAYWTSSTPGVAVISNAESTAGRATAVAPGSTAIAGETGGQAGTATLTVTPALLATITVSPAATTIPLGASQSFSAVGSYTDGSTRDITNSVAWTTSLATVAVVGNESGSQGGATSSGPGTTTITATADGVSGSATLTVTDAALVSIGVSPGDASVFPGKTERLRATGSYADGATADVSALAAWTSSAPDIATVDAAGSATGVAAGAATIQAALGSISGSANLTVQSNAFVSIAIAPSSATVPVGATQQFTAAGTYSDGNTIDASKGVGWSISGAGTIDASGKVLATAVGTATITATSGGLTASATLAAQDPAPTTVAIAPAATSVPSGFPQQLVATATYADGSTKDVTATASWTSSDTSVASVVPTGAVNGVAPGSANIRASMGNASAAASVRVLAFVSITVAPQGATMNVGSAEQFRANAIYSDGSVRDVTALASWRSAAPLVAAVGAGGVVSAVGEGNTAIQAFMQGVTGSARVAVKSIDIVCESNNTVSATYRWNDTGGWRCYTQGQVPAPGEWPGKHATTNYIAVIGATTNANVVTEHNMNVNATLGVLGKSYARWSVTGASDNGSGLIRVTTGPNTVATGDKVFCYGFNGTGGSKAYGIWTATAVDTTHFDLQGSSYGGMSGQSRGTCEFPASLKRQGASNSATTVGKWSINAGVTARFRGDVIDSWGYNSRQTGGSEWDTSFWMVRCGDAINGGCTWIWDGTGPVAYKTSPDSIGTDTAHLSYFVRGTHAKHALLTCLDYTDPAKPVGCTRARQGSFAGFRNFRAAAGSDMDYVDISNLGSGGYWLAIYADASTVFRLTHFNVASSGGINFPGFVPMPSTRFALAYGKFAWDACRVSSGCLNLFNTTTPLTIGPAVVFEPIAAPILASSNGAHGGIKFDRVYFAFPPTTAGPSAGSAVTDSIIARALKNGSPEPFGIEYLLKSFVWQYHDTVGGNPHNLSIPAANSGVIQVQQMTIDGNVFQGDGGYADPAGQMLDQSSYTSKNASFADPVSITVRNNVMVPNYEFDGTDEAVWHSSNSVTFLGSSAPATVAQWRIHNNTIFATTESAALHLDHASYRVQPNVIAEWRCNAVAVSRAAGTHYLIWAENLIETDKVTPSGIHHNAGFGDIRLTTNANATNAVGTYYYLKLSSPPGGFANGTDQWFPGRAPKVVDRTRRLRTWAIQKYGSALTEWMDANHAGTDLNATGNDGDSYVLEFLRADYNRILDIPDLVSWMKAGWTLREPSLVGACGDGTSIGMAATQ